MHSLTLIFRHGWGMSPRFWDPLLPFFAQDICHVEDQGYFETAVTQYRPSLWNLERSLTVGIGHSLGFWTLCRDYPTLPYVIGLNAFTHFLGYGAKVQSKRRDEVLEFEKNFTLYPHKTLRTFYRRSGVSGAKISALNTHRLAQDFPMFYTAGVRPAASKILILNTEDDSVVPPNITEDNFCGVPGVTVHMMSLGQHGLGWNQAAVVAQHIRRFLG